jgi:hypothetical protein
MIRTIVSLPEEDKRWLGHYSHLHHQSTARTIRMAIKPFKQHVAGTVHSSVLRETAGVLKGGPDSVEFVRRLRDEWE